MEPTEPIENFLRQSLTAKTAPTLSSDFQQQLQQRLQPRRMSKKQYRFLIAYALTGLAASVTALRLAGFSISLTLLCVLAPLLIVAALLRTVK
jgi:hypothetical protein